jgi:hypothetical protein
MSDEKKLARLLEHVAATPYYEPLLARHSGDPWERFLSLPVVDRQERARHSSAFVSCNLARDATSRAQVADLLSADSNWDNEARVQLSNGRRIVLEKTSGSTGTPLRMVKTDLERMAAGKAVWALRRKEDPSITPATMFPFEHAPLGFEFPFDLGDYSPSNVGNCLQEIGRRGYTWLHGHPQGLEWWAEILTEHPEFAGYVKFRRIESNGSRLTPLARRRIHGAFGCPVIDNYNCREVWTIGYECGSGTMHVHNDCVIVETIGTNGHVLPRGNVGSLVVTSLCAYAMPFVRYELGDRLAWDWSKCPCGVEGQTIHFPEAESADAIAGYAGSGGDVFSKVTRFLFGSFAFKYEAIRVLGLDRGSFDVWVGGFRGSEREFTQRFGEISATLLDPLQVRFAWHFVEPTAAVFREHPRALYVSSMSTLATIV